MPSFQPKFVDLVRNATDVEGTGPVTPGAAVGGYSGFAEAVQPGDRFYYCIQGIDKPGEREVGRGALQADGTIAREPIGAATNFGPGNKTISLVAAAEWFTRLDQMSASSSAPLVAADRVALSEMPNGGGQLVMLAEDRRLGTFLFDPADLSATVAADVLQGIYVAPASDPTGASGAWVRQGDRLTPHMFGATESLKFGNRLTGTPWYHEQLFDATAQIQALIDMVRMEENKAWVADLSGFWGLSDPDGDGYCILIEQPYWLVREYRMGHFALCTDVPGRAVFKMANACYNHRTTGRWEIWGGNSGDADSFRNRVYAHAIEARTISLWDIESLYCRGFRKWGVTMPATPIDAQFNQNIGAKFGRLKASLCGSVPDRQSLRFSCDYSGGIRTGTGSSLGQRSLITLDEPDAARQFDTADDDWVVINGEPYQVMAVDTATNQLSLYPWLPAGEDTSGTLYGMFGGAIHVAGSDTARVKIELLDAQNCGIGAYSRGLYGISVHECLVQAGGAALVIGAEGGNTIGNAVLGTHWEANMFDLVTRNEGGSNTMICVGAMGADDAINPFKLCRAVSANDGLSLNSSQAFPNVSFTVNGVDYHSGEGQTKSRAYTPTLSNDPRWSRVRKVADSVSATLKYMEPVDRFFRDHFVASLEVSGLSGGAPLGTVSVALDAADAAAGVKLDGGTAPLLIEGATDHLHVEFWLDTQGSVRNWRPIFKSGKPPPEAGIVILDDSGGNTSVTAAETGGFQIAKTGGADGSYDAAAISTEAITGDHLLRIRWIAGTFVAGVAIDPAASDGFEFPGVKLYMDGAGVAVFSFGGQIGSVQAHRPYAWIRRVAAIDAFEFYVGDTDNFSAATLFHRADAYGQGNVWAFDSSLRSLGASFEALFDA